MIPPFTPHQPTAAQLSPRDLTEAQSQVKRVLDEIVNTRRPWLSSEVLRASGADVECDLVQARENLVEHGLGKTVQGWRVVDLQGPAFVWRITSPVSSGYDSTKYLCLACSASVTVKLEVW